jgi:hypothetical protein
MVIGACSAKSVIILLDWECSSRRGEGSTIRTTQKHCTFVAGIVVYCLMLETVGFTLEDMHLLFENAHLWTPTARKVEGQVRAERQESNFGPEGKEYLEVIRAEPCEV